MKSIFAIVYKGINRVSESFVHCCLLRLLKFIILSNQVIGQLRCQLLSPHYFLFVSAWVVNNLSVSPSFQWRICNKRSNSMLLSNRISDRNCARRLITTRYLRDLQGMSTCNSLPHMYLDLIMCVYLKYSKYTFENILRKSLENR